MPEATQNQKFGLADVKLLMIAGTGFFSDAYDIFIIGLVMPMIGFIYFDHAKGTLPSFQGPVKGASSVGTLVGQLLFGYLGDALGRKKIYGFELILIILGTIMSIAAPSYLGGWGILIWLFVFRMTLLGVGIGGDYPLSAAVTSERSNVNRRGRMLASIFSMQGWGNLTAALVVLVLLSIFKSSVGGLGPNDVAKLEPVWRLAIGIGAIPSLCTVYSRLTMKESEKFQKDVVDKKSLENAQKKPSQMKIFREYFGRWKNAKVLIGTAGSWFLLDIAFYGINLNQSVVLQTIGFAKGSTPWETLFKAAIGNVIISALGFLPGYWFTIAFVDKMGRKPIQLMGFAVNTVLFLILAVAFDPLTKNASGAGFIVLFALTQFFSNFGANSTTFIIPGEVFPTRVRSTAHGISAASGKLGVSTPYSYHFEANSQAIISTFGFNALVSNIGLPGVLGIFCGVMALGIPLTLLIPETKGLDLDAIEDNENDTASYDSSSIDLEKEKA